MKKKIALLSTAMILSLMANMNAFAKGYTIRLTPNGAPVKTDENSSFYRDDLYHAGEETDEVFTEYVHETFGSDNSEVIDTKYTYIPGKTALYPGWSTSDGYYYYTYDVWSIAKSTTTPDGYVVDAQGRWVDEAGNPISDGFGNNRIGTTEMYAGKTGDEIYDLQRNQMIELAKKNVKHYFDAQDRDINSANGFVYLESETDVGGGLTANGLHVFNHNCKNYQQGGTYHAMITVSTLFDKGKVGEIALRIYLGDDLGIELFNYLRSIASASGEIDYNNFDMNKFAGRTTDYGKKVLFEHDEGYSGLYIKILN